MRKTRPENSSPRLTLCPALITDCLFLCPALPCPALPFYFKYCSFLSYLRLSYILHQHMNIKVINLHYLIPDPQAACHLHISFCTRRPSSLLALHLPHAPILPRRERSPTRLCPHVTQTQQQGGEAEEDKASYFLSAIMTGSRPTPMPQEEAAWTCRVMAVSRATDAV